MTKMIGRNPKLKKEVLVTRRGQTTIPIEIRRKLRINEGTRLKVETSGDKVVFTKAKTISVS